MNEKKSTTINNSSFTTHNSPRLRFPEFENAGEWEEKSLSSLAENLSNKRIPITSNIREKGKIPYYGATGIIDYVKDYIFNENLLLISEDGANLIDRNYPIAFSISGKSWVNNHAHILKFKNKATQKLVEKYINFISIEDYLTGLAQPKLNRTNLDKVSIPLPNLKEQQKIADCLSSLDELITSQSQKLDALKQHKKGLMQNLFPAEGQTTHNSSFTTHNSPPLRFPEFQNAGEWKENNLYSLLDNVLDFRGRTPKKLNMEWGDGEIVSLSANNVKNGYIDFNAECNLGSLELYTKWMLKTNLKKGDIVFTMEAPLGNALLIPDDRKYILSQRVVAFQAKNNVNNQFLIQLIWSVRFQSALRRLSTGSTAKGINQKTLKTVVVLFPKTLKEQQKIADCLSSLDELITAQSQKIAALKQHKKGLMQNLFPNPVIL